MIDNRTVGKTIAKLRQAKGMTQQQLAAAMNVSHQAVSKWENGAALPDIQTLVGLTQLFGITVEQLLSGEIPESRLEDREEDAFSERVHNIGSFVNNVINDIGSAFKGEEKPPETSEEDRDAAPEEPQTNVDLQKLLEMAPYMSKSAVSEMLEKCGRKLTAAEIARFAPFVDPSCLEKLIRESEGEITWDSLRRLAPFLRREAVDALAQAVALGHKLVRPAANDVGRTAEDAWKTVEHVSRKIERGVDRAVRRVVRMGEDVVSEVSKVFDDRSGETPSREDRLASLRRSAIERALEEGRWDWIAAHLDEVQDDELRRSIAEKANREGMQDWILEHLGGYADSETIDKAISDGNWSWLGEHAEAFEPAVQRKVALAAVENGRWDWLSARVEQLDLGDAAAEIAYAARLNGEKTLAAQLVRQNADKNWIVTLAMDAAEEGDCAFVEMIAEVLSAETIGDCCAELVRQEGWDCLEPLMERLDVHGMEKLMELAIELGDFDAVDRMDAMIRGTEEK